MLSLTFLLIVPAVFAVICGFVPAKQAKTVALVGTGITFALTLLALFGYNGAAVSNGIYQAVEQRPWFPALNISYGIGVDGPGLLMVMLTAFLSLMAVWYSSEKITERENVYYALMLSLEATVVGAFLSLDLVLFYIFFEACLVPAYFLIGLYGGRNRVAAATKFFVYTVVGSLLMLASIIALYLYTGTFDVVQIQQKVVAGTVPAEVSVWIFLGFAVAFAVKTGLFPLHTWLPDAYAEAPSPVTAILSGAMAKLGTFGLYRFCVTLLPDAAQTLAPLMITLGVISIIYAALIAAMQRDVKRAIAYSSVSHLGFVVAGLFSGTAAGLSGSILQMVNHGITSGLLFLMVGMIEARRGTTNVHALGGLWEQMPQFARVLLIATLSSVGLPLTNGFVGEFLILLGTFQNYPALAILGTTGVIWSAVYMLRMFQRAMYGAPVRPEVRRMTDLTGNEYIVVAPFVALIFLLGVQPGILQHKTDGAVKTFTDPASAIAAPPVEATQPTGSVPEGAVALPDRGAPGSVPAPPATGVDVNPVPVAPRNNSEEPAANPVSPAISGEQPVVNPDTPVSNAPATPATEVANPETVVPALERSQNNSTSPSDPGVPRSETLQR